jgi:hypothetical protein
MFAREKFPPKNKDTQMLSSKGDYFLKIILPGKSPNCNHQPNTATDCVANMANITRTTSEKQANKAKPVPEATKCFEEIPAAGDCMICHESLSPQAQGTVASSWQSQSMSQINNYLVTGVRNWSYFWNNVN